MMETESQHKHSSFRSKFMNSIKPRSSKGNDIRPPQIPTGEPAPPQHLKIAAQFESGSWDAVPAELTLGNTVPGRGGKSTISRQSTSVRSELNGSSASAPVSPTPGSRATEGGRPTLRRTPGAGENIYKSSGHHPSYSVGTPTTSSGGEGFGLSTLEEPPQVDIPDRSSGLGSEVLQYPRGDSAVQTPAIELAADPAYQPTLSGEAASHTHNLGTIPPAPPAPSHNPHPQSGQRPHFGDTYGLQPAETSQRRDTEPGVNGSSEQTGQGQGRLSPSEPSPEDGVGMPPQQVPHPYALAASRSATNNYSSSQGGQPAYASRPLPPGPPTFQRHQAEHWSRQGEGFSSLSPEEIESSVPGSGSPNLQPQPKASRQSRPTLESAPWNIQSQSQVNASMPDTSVEPPNPGNERSWMADPDSSSVPPAPEQHQGNAQVQYKAYQQGEATDQSEANSWSEARGQSVPLAAGSYSTQLGGSNEWNGPHEQPPSSNSGRPRTIPIRPDEPHIWSSQQKGGMPPERETRSSNDPSRQVPRAQFQPGARDHGQMEQGRVQVPPRNGSMGNSASQMISQSARGAPGGRHHEPQAGFPPPKQELSFEGMGRGGPQIGGYPGPHHIPGSYPTSVEYPPGMRNDAGYPGQSYQGQYRGGSPPQGMPSHYDTMAQPHPSSATVASGPNRLKRTPPNNTGHPLEGPSHGGYPDQHQMQQYNSHEASNQVQYAPNTGNAVKNKFASIGNLSKRVFGKESKESAPSGSPQTPPAMQQMPTMPVPMPAMPVKTIDEYEKRAEALLTQFERPQKVGFGWFDTLILWAEEQADAAKKAKGLPERIAELEKSLKEARRSVEAYTQELGAKRKEAQGLQASVERGDRDLQAAGMRMSRLENETRDLKAEIQTQKNAVIREREDGLRRYNDLRMSAETEIARVMADYDRQIQEKDKIIQKVQAEQRKAVQDETQKLDREVARLNKRVATLSPTGNYRLITDDVFSDRLKNLSQQVTNLVWYCHEPASFALDKQLDPTRYLERMGSQRGWPQFVKYTCWRVIIKGLFHLPLGFGAFGSEGNGFQEIMQVREFFVPSSTDNSNVLAPIPNEADANGKRAWLFNNILQQVTSSNFKVRPPSPTDPWRKYAELFHENIQAVSMELETSLRQVCNDGLNPEASAEIFNVVYDLGVLALMMASQRAHVFLDFCAYPEKIKTGDRFKDDNDSANKTIKVDLMTRPALVRLGDGHNNLSKEEVLVHGEVVALNEG